MPNVRPLNKDKYEISKHRFLELYHFCLQYPEWKEELKHNTSTVKSIQITDMPTAHNHKDQTAELAERRASLSKKCEIIEQTVIEVDSELYQWILEGVTRDYASYRYLLMTKEIPCDRNTYYKRRRLFYYLLSKKI